MSATNRRPLLALLAANAISQFGNTLSFLAIPWFVLEITGSASLTGIAVAARTLPVIILGLFGGGVVDRLGYRRSSIVSDVASGLTIAGIPLLYLTFGLEYWQLLLLIFLGAVLDMPGAAARRSLMPELADLAGMRLERANVSYQLTNRVAMLFGPPAAGVLVGLIGASNVLWFNAATFALSSIAIVLGVPRDSEAGVEVDETPPQRYLQDIRDGFRFVWNDRTIFWLLTATSIGSLLAEPFYSVIMPVYGREVLDSSVGLGLAFSGLALGSIAGNLLYAWKGLDLPRRALVVGGFAGRAVIFCVIVLQPGTVMLTGLLFISGIMLEPVNPIMQTVLQERVPPRMRGRVFSASMALGMGSMPAGVIVYGFILEYLNLQSTLVILAAVNLVLPLIMWTSRSLRRLDDTPPQIAGATVQPAHQVLPLDADD